jgi:A/G-specific adenine glycosylase
VSCFAHGRRMPIVDANVLRVFARIFGLPAHRELRRSRQEWAIAWALLPGRYVAQHNYGLLDFAAQVCTPRSPRCSVCHIRESCAYGKTQRSAVEVHQDNDVDSRL